MNAGFRLILALLAIILLAALWKVAAVQPESPWLRSPLRVALVIAAGSMLAVSLQSSGRPALLAVLAAAAVFVGSGLVQIWDQWDAMTYDRGAGSAAVEAIAYLLETFVIGGLGFAFGLFARHQLQASRGG